MLLPTQTVDTVKRFRDYPPHQRRSLITLATGDFYPDMLEKATSIYLPVLERFGALLSQASNSSDLLIRISHEPNTWFRTQLCRVFRKYVSPATPVEMLRRNTRASQICEQFETSFRPLQEVKACFNQRPMPDEALCALLWEYKDRGKKGYELTENLFNLIQAKFPCLSIWGPKRAGNDVQAKSIWADYPNSNRPLDFILSDQSRQKIYAVGLARYDSDRGGAQEDDRIGGYHNCAREILAYTKTHGLKTKIIFINDGPGLLIGSMWEDYSRLEDLNPKKIKVMTLRMIEERLSLDWLTEG